MTHRPPSSPLFPYTTLFRSLLDCDGRCILGNSRPVLADRKPSTDHAGEGRGTAVSNGPDLVGWHAKAPSPVFAHRSEEHTSELQSHHDLVCRLLLEKKKKE